MFYKSVLVLNFLLKLLPISVNNVYRYLWGRYGQDTSYLFGELVTARIQVVTLKYAISFMTTCKTERLWPTFVRFHVSIPRLATSKVVQQCREKILQEELKFKKRLLHQTGKHVARLEEELKQIIPPLSYVRLQSISNEFVSSKTRIIVARHQGKLESLRMKKLLEEQRRQEKLRREEIRIAGEPLRKVDPITNLSKYVLSESERNALVNGLHHVYPSEQFDQPQLVCNMEYFYARLLSLRTTYRHYESKPADVVVPHKLSPAQLSAASELRETANTFRRIAQSDFKRVGIEHRGTFNALRSLAKNKSVVITRPDKGRGVVLMDLSKYNQKMNVILSDLSTFTPITLDPTIENENRLITLLLQFKNDGFISDSEYNLARPRRSRPSRLYGLPKLHKEDKSLRPVMSATKTVGYGLGKMLTNRMSHLRISPYVVKDTFDFVNKIRSSKHIDKTMVSFDVKSLFTCVPLSYTLDLILDKLYPSCSLKCENQARSQLCAECRRRRDFESLLKIATSETHFTFDGKMYVQHNGVAMGAPLAPVIADIFMSHLEVSLMDRLIESGVCEWYRYVDDTFILMEPTAEVDDVLAILNSFHPSITFTKAPEIDGSLPFLDVRVTRPLVGEKFETTIYRKPTFTGLLTKWSSFVPIQYKKSCIISMVQRALAVCSSYTLLSVEFDDIRKLGLQNGYSLSFIEARIGIALDKYRKRNTRIKTPIIGSEKKRMYVEIPYAGRATYSFKKKLSRLVGKIRPDLDVRYYAKPPPPVQSFFNIKDPVPKPLTADIVYSVECGDCAETYVGKTVRQAVRRLWEHGAPKSIFPSNLPPLDLTDTITNPDVRTENTNFTDTRRNNGGPIRNTTRTKVNPYPDPAALRRSLRIQAMKTQSDNHQTHDPDKEKEKTESILPRALLAPHQHEKQHGHHMKWEEFNVVWQDSNPYKLLVRESLIIQAHKPVLNKTTHSIPLTVFPDGLPKHLTPDPNRSAQN
ncbi:unnamed protein product [Adineta steineri]|uniref:Reverse transcriptase domain-containing protein n=1 Tax=Adineta steineri TaxID=433720 RepID=A0A819Y932_9BILA|nr:unnamed protein product [Adineta steineri]CAF4154837.1 unnamed protein product [Adineta steineri]